MFKSFRTSWLIAASTSAIMLVAIASKVMDLSPGATVIDVGALAFTGILTGLFLALSITYRRRLLQTAE